MVSMPLKKWIDIPPVWLFACLAVALVEAQFWPGPAMGLPHAVGTGFLVTGLLIMLLAVVQMMAAKTTPIPHQMPQRLVDGGVFAVSRNPIYLGDLMVLAGCCLRWEAWFSLVLVPVLFVILERRFIEAEEARLLEAFPEDAPEYLARVRRWI